MARSVKKAKAAAVYGALRKRFRAKDGHTKKGPMERLMFAMLAQHSSRKDAERAFSTIRTSYVDWNEFRVASLRNLSVLMRSKGCSPKSAETMKAFLQNLFLDTHGVSILLLQKMSTKRAREYIEKTTRLRPEQAAAVLVTAFDMPVSPILPAIKRVLARLRLAQKGASESRFQDAFQTVAARGKASTAHRVLHMLARDFCHKDDPLCARCPVKKHCPTGQDREKRKKEAKKRKKAEKAKKKTVARKPAKGKRKPTKTAARKKKKAAKTTKSRKKPRKRTASPKRKKK